MVSQWMNAEIFQAISSAMVEVWNNVSWLFSASVTDKRTGDKASLIDSNVKLNQNIADCRRFQWNYLTVLPITETSNKKKLRGPCSASEVYRLSDRHL
jgi:hypothetical protein